MGWTTRVQFLKGEAHPDWLWSPSSLLSIGTGGSFPGGKVARVWGWSLTNI